MAELTNKADLVVVLHGRIIESVKKEAHPIAKLFSGLGCLFMSIYYLIAIALCFTLVGAIFGIPMFIGAAGIQAMLFSVLVDGTKYKIECPVCQREIPDLFKPDKQVDLCLKCPSCKKDLIVRGEEVLHFQ